MAERIDPPKSRLSAIARLMQSLAALARHGSGGALLGRRHWLKPKDVREALEELGLVCLKFGQVLAMRHDLLPAAYTQELELLHDDLPAMDMAEARAPIAGEMRTPLTHLFATSRT